MDHHQSRNVIQLLYKYVLKRSPQPEEFEYWSNRLASGDAVEAVIRAFGESEEHKKKNLTVPFFPPGHYYSPIVQPDEGVRKYLRAEAERIGRSPNGIDMMLDRMKSFFAQNAKFIASANFTSCPDPNRRYYSENGGYPLGDAFILRAMIKHFLPSRIIEIGSGFSSACILDVADELGLADLHLVCIEPNPERLKSLVRPSDKLELLACPVQEVPLDRFRSLGENDFLFIDSTHIIKTGSDVHYELFNILPNLARGVMIHFHDLQYPFEYPQEWIFKDNYSWNEAYAVRAFLMYNSSFSPYYSNTMLAQTERSFVYDLFPGFPENPGSGFWVRREQ